MKKNINHILLKLPRRAISFAAFPVTAVFVLFIFFFTGDHATAYVLLENSIIGGKTGDVDPGEYFKNLYQIGVGIAGVLAVIMLVIGGIEYISSAVIDTKAEAKKRIWAAIGGLLLALVSYILLGTINQKFVNSSLTLQQVTAPTPKGPGKGGTGTTVPCENCTPVTGVPIKDGAGNQLNQDVAQRAIALNAALAASKIGWRITEGYPPEAKHDSPCHSNGMCYDANFTNAAFQTAENINLVAKIAGDSGQKAIWEVPTVEAAAALLKAKPAVLEENIRVVTGVTPHFHIELKR